jgi:hypothetical protein
LFFYLPLIFCSKSSSAIPIGNPLKAIGALSFDAPLNPPPLFNWLLWEYVCGDA